MKRANIFHTEECDIKTGKFSSFSKHDNRRGIILLISLLCCTFFIQASELSKANALKQIDSGNAFYKSNQYQEAIQSYETALSGSYESATLYFNLGNAYFRTNDFAHAIINYERALRLSPTDEDIRQNLNVANAKIVDKVDEVPQIFLARWLNALLHTFSGKGWAAISIILMFAACIGIGVFLISKVYKWRKVGFYTGTSFLLLTVGAFFCAQQTYQRQNMQNEAIVMQPLLVAKSSPAESGVDKFVIHEGTKIQISDAVDNWVKIKLPDGNIGWVEKRGVEVI